MAPVLNKSPLVSVAWTNITSGSKDTDVLAWDTDVLTLWMGLHVDLSLFGQNYEFLANFQITEVATKKTLNHLWRAPLDGLKPYAPSLYINWTWPRAADAGVVNSAYAYFGVNNGDGLHLYRPYFLVLAPKWYGELPGFDGRGEFAESEEHYFLLESGS